VIGLRGPVASERLAVGFLLLGPETEYPAHHHAAEEIYVQLSGLALWRRSEEDWRLRTPGTPIHYASGQSHAMRTRQTPLLALYLWRGGDLAEKSRFG
jgi:mannose-6-phosphate isomerase-like protein (cupin superfamily)